MNKIQGGEGKRYFTDNETTSSRLFPLTKIGRGVEWDSFFFLSKAHSFDPGLNIGRGAGDGYFFWRTEAGLERGSARKIAVAA